jgi:hypothetical protein
MEKSYGHKVDKYALIYSAASEILKHMEELMRWSDSNSYFHVLQMEKAAMFIQFVEDVCIIAGSEEFTGSMISGMWRKANEEIFDADLNMSIKNLAITNVIERYQKRINGKFLTKTAPF